jgi:hypothetical protein
MFRIAIGEKDARPPPTLESLRKFARDAVPLESVREIDSDGLHSRPSRTMSVLSTKRIGPDCPALP